MTTIHAALLALSFLSAPATAQEAARENTDAAPWRLFDRVEVIVNEEIVTVSEFDRAFREFVRTTGRTPTTERQVQEVSILVAQREVDSLLAEQGGRDLGFDEQQVRRMVENWEDSLIEEAGGVGQRSEALLETGSAAHLERRQLTGNIYRISWERAVTGRDAGPLGRPTRDRYVRPGQLRRLYDQADELAGGMEQLGAVAGAYRLQLLVIDVDAQDGMDEALALAEEVQRRLADGEDFDALVEEHGAARGEQSLLRPLSHGELQRIAEQDDAWAELAGWALEASVGDHSGVIYREERGAESLQIAHLLQRPEPRPFRDADTQAALRQYVQDVHDSYYRGLALEELKRAAYIWTPAFEPAAEDADPSEDAERAGPPLP